MNSQDVCKDANWIQTISPLGLKVSICKHIFATPNNQLEQHWTKLSGIGSTTKSIKTRDDMLKSLFTENTSHSYEFLFDLNNYLSTNINVPQSSNIVDSTLLQLPTAILSSIAKYLTDSESIYTFGNINRELYIITQSVSFFKDKTDRILSLNGSKLKYLSNNTNDESKYNLFIYSKCKNMEIIFDKNESTLIQDLTTVLKNYEILRNIVLTSVETITLLNGPSGIKSFNMNKYLPQDENKLGNLDGKYSYIYQIRLKMIELDTDTKEFKKDVLVRVNRGGGHAKTTIGDIRKHFAVALGLDEKDAIKIRMIIVDRAVSIAMLLSDDNELILQYKISDGSSIHVEICEKNHLEGQSSLLKKMDEVLNTIQLKYNLLDCFENVKFNGNGKGDYKDIDIYDQSIEIDIRRTVGWLREQLAQIFNVDVDKLVIRRNFNDSELKDNSKSLARYRLNHVFVELGTPLKPTEYLLQIFIQDEKHISKLWQLTEKKMILNAKKKVGDRMGINININNENDSKIDELETLLAKEESKLNDDDGFLYVGNTVVDKTWDMTRVKQEIYKSCDLISTGKAGIDIKHMRIREFYNGRLTRTYYDSKTLGKNAGAGLKDYKSLCVQKTKIENEILDKNSILCYVAQWFPQKLIYSQPAELMISKQWKIKTDLKSFLSSYSGINIQHIRYCLPRKWCLKPEKIETICHQDWENVKCGNNHDATVGGSPWRAKSGDYILFKDARQKELFGPQDFDHE